MHEFIASSAFFGVFISLAAYFIGMALRRKTGLSLFNPLLVSILLVMDCYKLFRRKKEGANNA